MIQNLSYPASRLFVWVTLGISVIVSVLLSIWSIAIDSVINNDGIEYVRAAEFLSSGDWQAAFAAYKWPFYPWLIMLVGNTAEISYKTAGHALNTGFFSLVVVFFVCAVRAFGGRSRSITLIAMLLGLSHPAFNEYRGFLIRDPGYLAAYLLAVCCIAQYRWRPRGHYRLAAIGSLVIASLFRIEGLVFLFAVPLILSRGDAPARQWPQYVIGALLLLILGAAFVLWLLIPEDPSNTLLVIEDPIKGFAAGWDQIRSSVTENLSVLRQEFLGPHSADYAYLLFGFIAVSVFASAILSELAIPYAVLIAYGVSKRVFFQDGQLQKLWFRLILINGVILSVFALIMLFLAPRYPLAMAITALIAAPFVLEKLISAIQNRELKKFGWAMLVICLLWAIGESYSGVTNFSRNFHLRDAGYWLHETTTSLNASGPIVTNNRKIAYYASVRGNREVLIMDGQQLINELPAVIRELGSDFAGIRVRRSERSIEAMLNKVIRSRPVKVIDNNHGDRVLLYDLRF